MKHEVRVVSIGDDVSSDLSKGDGDNLASVFTAKVERLLDAGFELKFFQISHPPTFRDPRSAPVILTGLLVKKEK